MNKNEIRKEMVNFVKSMNENHKDAILPIVEEIQIDISPRMTSTLGQVTFSRRDLAPVKTTFNKKYIEYGEKEDVIDTIRHEVIHILANAIFGANIGHSEKWKRLCVLYGVQPNSSKNTNYRENYERVNGDTKKAKPTTPTTYKYHIICSECGKIVAKRQRLSESLLKRYVSSCHSAELQALEVETGKIITF